MSDLREMVKSDLSMVLGWRNSDQVRMNMYNHHLISNDEHESWWLKESRNPKTKLLIYERDGVPLGFVSFTGYTGESGIASWAFYSGDINQRGIGALMETAALNYAFDVLKVHRLECEVLSFNKKVVDFHRRHGFILEGVFRQAYEREGQFYDIYKLSMLKVDWERVKQTSKSLVGKKFVKSVEYLSESVSAFALASGDFNKIHMDTEAARAAGFPQRIAHGVLSLGYVSAFFANEFPGPGSIYVSQQNTFLHPILVGASGKMNISVVTHVGRRILLSADIVIDGKTCVSCEAVLLLPKEFSYE